MLYQGSGDNDAAVKAYQTYLRLAPQGEFAQDVKKVLQQLE